MLSLPTSLYLILFFKQFFWLEIAINVTYREYLGSFLKTLERERASVRARASVCMRCDPLYFADCGGGCFTMGKTVTLLTTPNSVTCHLIQLLHTSSQDVPVVRASHLRLCIFFLIPPTAVHFHSFSALRFLIRWVNRIDFRMNGIRGSQNDWLNCLSLGPARLCAGAIQFLFFLQACLVVMCILFFYPFFFSNLGLCFSQDHPLSPSVEHFGDINKISTEKWFHLGGLLHGI